MGGKFHDPREPDSGTTYRIYFDIDALDVGVTQIEPHCLNTSKTSYDPVARPVDLKLPFMRLTCEDNPS
jgi:hypothetical protein